MESEFIRQLLQQEEGPSIEFKWIYDLSKKGPGLEDEKGELTKDILALVNTEEPKLDDNAYLLIGVADKKKSDGNRDLLDVAGQYQEDQLNQIVNDKCDPRVIFRYIEVPIDSKTIGVISIPFSPVLHELKKDIYAKKHIRWPSSTIFYRVGAVIYPANQSERNLLTIKKKKALYHKTTTILKDLSEEVRDLLYKEIEYILLSAHLKYEFFRI